MILSVYSVKNKIIDNLEVKSVYVPAISGDMEILNDHIPILAALKKGTLIIQTKEKQKIKIPLDTGYIQSSDNIIVIVLEKTSLTLEQLQEIEQKAVIMRDKKEGKDEDITEDEFEHFEDSEQKKTYT